MCPERIVMLGDSLTEYNVWNGIEPEAEVINHGLSGDTTGGLIYRLGRVALARPDLIVLQIGINDLSQGRDPEEIVAGHRRVWAALAEKAPASKLLVCSLAPVEEDIFGWPTMTLSNKRVLKTNELLEAAVREAGLDWLDLYGPLSAAAETATGRLTQDGVHLTGLAYAVWTAVLRAWLESRGRGSVSPGT